MMYSWHEEENEWNFKFRFELVNEISFDVFSCPNMFPALKVILGNLPRV